MTQDQINKVKAASRRLAAAFPDIEMSYGITIKQGMPAIAVRLKEYTNKLPYTFEGYPLDIRVIPLIKAQ